MDDEYYEKYIKAINDLFITRRDKYISQRHDGTYDTMPNEKCKDKRPLTDSHILNHLKQEATYGVFADDTTKFMAFDIDGNGLENARYICNMLINKLREFGIDRQYIHTEYSGTKGYHVYVFFAERYNTKAINRLQKIIIDKLMGTKYYDKSWGNIEVRPTASQAIKLPLGLHRKNNTVCWFCDEYNIPIENLDYLLQIKKFPHDKMEKIFIKIKLDNNTDFGLLKVMRNEARTSKCVSNENAKIAIDALENGIQFPHVRHDTLLSLCLYFKSEGLNEEKCLSQLQNWMMKQDESIITTPKIYWNNDVKRVVHDIYSSKNVYENYKKSNTQTSEIYVTKELIEHIHTQKLTRKQRVILFYLMLNQIKYADRLEDGGFRCSNSQIERNAKVSYNSAKKIPSSLAKMGLVNRDSNKSSNNPIVKAMTLYGNIPTWYKMNDEIMNLIHGIKSTSDGEKIQIVSNKPIEQQMDYALWNLFEENEISTFMKRDALKTSYANYIDACKQMNKI